MWCEDDEAPWGGAVVTTPKGPDAGIGRSGGSCETQEPPPPDPDADKPPLEYIRTKLRNAEVELGKAVDKADSVRDSDGAGRVRVAREAVRHVRRGFDADAQPGGGE